MLKSVGEYGKGLKPSTYHEVRVSYLKKAVDNIQGSLEKYKVEWEKWGCTFDEGLSCSFLRLLNMV